MKYLLTLAILLCASVATFGQNVDGKIYELRDGKKLSLPGVNILWDGTTIGTTTDMEGKFRIKRVPSTKKLIISYVGYKSDTLLVDNKNYYEITLKGLKEINEVQIVEKNGAYFDQTKPLQTQTITKSELQKAACCNLSESFETNASVDIDYSDAVSGAKQIKLLGLAGKYTQIMKENIPGLRGLATTYGLNYVPGPWMESIQVSKGTASVVNGYESITGQINVEFKKTEHSDEKFYADWYQNSMYKSDINANYNHIFSDELSTIFFAHGEYSYKGVDHNSDSFYDMPMVRQVNLYNRWNYGKCSGISAQFGISYLNETREAGQRGYDHDLSNKEQDKYGIGIETQRVEVYSKVGNVFQNLQETSFGWMNKFVFHDQNSFFGLKNYDGKQISYYSNFIYSTILGSTEHKVSFGASYVYDKYDERLNESNFDRSESVPGTFFQYTYLPNPTLTLMAGIRADFHNNYGTFYTPRFHLKYNIDERTVARLSAGKGFRSPNVIAENSKLLASSRDFIFTESLDQEEVWNYGITLTKYFKLFERELTVNLEFHRTEFSNQVVVDMDSRSNEILIYNLDGEAYSNNIQLEMIYSPIQDLDLVLAHRITDVKTTIDGELTEKPLVSKYKSLLNLSYISKLKVWQYDVTFQLNGPGRIPAKYNELYGKEFDPFLLVNFQITRKFRYFDSYFGAENLTGYKQNNPIISADNPFSNSFDASTVWAPISGAKFYLGIRYSL